MADNKNKPVTALAAPASQILTIRTSLIKRGLDDISRGAQEDASFAAALRSFEFLKAGRLDDAFEISTAWQGVGGAGGNICWEISGICAAAARNYAGASKSIRRALGSISEDRVKPVNELFRLMRRMIIANKRLEKMKVIDVSSEPFKLASEGQWAAQDLLAEIVTNMGLELNPNSSPQEFSGWWGEVGHWLLGRGRYEDAIRAYEAQIRKDPSHADSYLEKGIALKRLGYLESAIKWYDRFSELEPKSVSGQRNKALALLELHRYKDVIECCDRALAMDADEDQRLSLLNDKGVALKALGKAAEALDCYELALSFERTWKNVKIVNAAAIRTWQNKATLLDELGRYQEALACDDAVLMRDSETPEHWENKARRLRLLGREREAAHCDSRAATLKKG
jgi:tetratricopeptide (TPR) repeat protein